MAFPITDNILNLPRAELYRLQKYLGIILSNVSQSARLRQVILSVYRQMGNPFEYLVQNGRGESSARTMHRLLESFGALSVSHLNQDEIDHLKENPYTVWPDEETCLVAEEALDIFPSSTHTEKTAYLFAYLRCISPREKKAWSRWLSIPDAGNTDRKRNRILYATLADRRMQYSCAAETHSFPDYIEEVFPDDLSKCPVAWFYRDVIPFYDALERTERIALNEQQQLVLLYLKIGKLIIVEERSEFGKQGRHRLLFTKEGTPAFFFPGHHHLDSNHEKLFP